MKIIVCVKQVPRLDQVRFQAGLNRIVREGVPAQINPLDVAALGHALALRARHGGEVVAVTMGPPAACDVLREALELGVDRAIHLVDVRFAGADTLATARALARVVDREDPDLVLLGRSTVDGGTAQVAPQLAEFTGLAQCTHATDINLSIDGLRVSRETEAGDELWHVPLPAVVSVEGGPTIPTPDRPGGSHIAELDADALGADACYGIRGSATYVQRVVDTPGERAGRRTTDALELIRLIERERRPDAAHRYLGSGAGEVAAEFGVRDIWVVADPYRDGLHPVTAEAVAAARAVAPQLGAAVTGVLLAASAGAAPAGLAAAGADRVLVVQAPALATYAPEPYTDALASVVAQRSPFAVIGGWTARGRDFLPRVAARLAAGMTGDVVGLAVDPHPGDASVLDLVWLKPAWAGTALARVVARTVPSFGTLRPGAVPALPEQPGRRVEVEYVATQPGAAGLAALIEVAHRDFGTPLEACRTLLLLGGRLESAEVVAAARLAGERGWGLAGTAAAVAAGQVPASAELSLRKRSLSPDLVVGLGLLDARDLDAARGARRLVVVDPTPAAELARAADLIGEFTPAAFLAAFAVIPHALA